MENDLFENIKKKNAITTVINVIISCFSVLFLLLCYFIIIILTFWATIKMATTNWATTNHNSDVLHLTTNKQHINIETTTIVPSKQKIQSKQIILYCMNEPKGII